jgi:inosine triphosphate pyrophosphatase
MELILDYLISFVCARTRSFLTQAAMATKPRVTFVSSNPNKAREVRELLPDFDVVTTSPELPPEIQGTAHEVAAAKCEAAARAVGGPCISEDTSLGARP